MLESLKNIDSATSLFISSLPKGYLYNKSLKPFIKGFLYEVCESAKVIDKAFKDKLDITANSYFLDEELTKFGLPNEIFTDLNTTNDKLFAISMMKLASTLNSKEDYENFLALFGYEAKFYHNNNIIDHLGFDYGFPVLFTESLGKKDKLTWLCYIAEGDVDTDYNGLGDAFDIDFATSPSDISFPKKVLDYIKPYDIIIEYISLDTKNALGL